VSLTLTLISSKAFWQVAVCRKTAVSTHNILSILPELELQKSGDKSMVYKPHHSLQTSLRHFLFCLLSFTTHNPNAIEVEILVTDTDRNIQEVQIHFLKSAGRFSPRKKRKKEAASALPDIVTVHPIDEHISPQIQKVYSRCCHRHLAVLLLLHDLQPILLIPKASTIFFCVGESAAPARVHSVFLRPIRTTLPSSQSSCACLRAPCTRGFVGSFHLGSARDLTR
jgi:hypothetical protein